MEFGLIFSYTAFIAIGLLVFLLWAGTMYHLIASIKDIIKEIRSGDKEIDTKAVLVFELLICIIFITAPCSFICTILNRT